MPPSPTPQVSSPSPVSGEAPAPYKSAADDIRQTWSKQASCDLASAEHLPQLISSSGTSSSSSTRRLPLTCKIDENSHKHGQPGALSSPANGRRRSRQSSNKKNSNHPTTQISSTMGASEQVVSGCPMVSTSFSFDQLNSDQAKTSLPPMHFSSLLLSVVPVQHSLASTDKCIELGREGVVCFMSRGEMKTDTDMVMENHFSRMEGIKQSARNGLAHWGGGKVIWTVLGETSAEAADNGYSQWDGGIGSRTRAASRKSAGWFGEQRPGAGVYSTNGDEGESKGLVNINVSNDTSDGEDWCKKKITQEISTTQSYEYEGSPSSSNLAPADSSYLDLSAAVGTITRNTLTSLVSMGSLTITALAGKVIGEREDGDDIGAVEPNRGVSERQDVETEQEGTCPMCGRVMRMKELLSHAPECQG